MVDSTASFSTQKMVSSIPGIFFQAIYTSIFHGTTFNTHDIFTAIRKMYNTFQRIDKKI